MRWYDLFSWTYDLQLEKSYRPWHEQLVERAGIEPGMRVLDLGCGTGQLFEFLEKKVGPEGRVLGLDCSHGMLGQARRRILKNNWRNVGLYHLDVCADWPEELKDFDVVVASMVFSAVPNFECAFGKAWGALKDGGRMAILDAHASTRTLQTRFVEKLAQADLDRRVWEELASRASDYERVVTEASPTTFGGELIIATGTRPAA